MPSPDTGSFGISAWLVAVVISELIAIRIIWKMWRSEDFLFFKLSLSVLALIPLVGPVLALWLGNFPTIQPRALQDRTRRRTDVYDRWRNVLEERNPVRRFRKWRAVMEQDREDP